MVAGEPEQAHLIGESEPAVELHRARILAVAFGMPALRGLGVEQRCLEAVEIEEERQHQSDRPAADDGDLSLLRFVRIRHAFPPAAAAAAEDRSASRLPACLPGSISFAIGPGLSRGGLRPDEIMAGRHAEEALEHGGKGGGTVVAEIQRDRGDRLGGGEARHCGEQAGLLAPGREAQARLLAEQAREGAAAHVQRVAPVVDRVVGLRLLQEVAAAFR